MSKNKRNKARTIENYLVLSVCLLIIGLGGWSMANNKPQPKIVYKTVVVEKIIPAPCHKEVIIKYRYKDRFIPVTPPPVKLLEKNIEEKQLPRAKTQDFLKPPASSVCELNKPGSKAYNRFCL